MNARNDPEWQYLNLIERLLDEGSRRMDRTGVGTRALFGTSMRFSLADGTIPLLTTKKVLWKSALVELLWFLSGETSIRPLIEQGVHIWTDWPMAKHRKETGETLGRDEFESRILEDPAFEASWGHTVGAYGQMWRAWPTKDGGSIDQISESMRLLREDPYSRRNLFHAWNVEYVPTATLPACHMVYQLGVSDGRLNMVMFQRSCDSFLGLGFNLVSCAFLLRMMADQAGLLPGEFQWFGGDTHLYENHVEAARTQLSRQPTGFPRLVLKRRPASLFDYRVEDFEVVGYEPHGFIKAPVAV